MPVALDDSSLCFFASRLLGPTAIAITKMSGKEMCRRIQELHWKPVSAQHRGPLVSYPKALPGPLLRSARHHNRGDSGRI